MKLALAVLVAACSSRSNEPQPPGSDRVVVADARITRDVITIATRELITAIADDWTSTAVTLRRYRREGTVWKPVGQPWPGVVGKSGLAWGSGLHGTGAPAGRTGPIKHEGDGASPAGAFVLGAG